MKKLFSIVGLALLSGVISVTAISYSRNSVPKPSSESDAGKATLVKKSSVADISARKNSSLRDAHRVLKAEQKNLSEAKPFKVTSSIDKKIEKKIAGGSDAFGNGRKAPRKASSTFEIPVPVGTFANVYGANTSSGGTTRCDMVEISQNPLGEGVNLFNMYGMETTTPCELTAIDWTVDDAGTTVKYPTLLIKGQGQQEAFTYNGTTYSYFLAENGESITLYGDDISWIVNEDTHTLQWPWGEGFGIAFANLDLGRAYYIDSPDFYLSNGTLKALIEVADYDAMEYYMAKYEEPVYAAKLSNQLIFPTVLGSPEMLVFNLASDGTATAKNQVFWDATSQGYGLFVWSDVTNDDSIDYGTLTGKLSGNVLSIGGPNWCTFSATVSDYYDYGEQTTVTFDFDYKNVKWPVLQTESTSNDIVTINYCANGVESSQQINPGAAGLYEVEISNLDWFYFVNNTQGYNFYFNLFESTLGKSLPAVSYLTTDKPYTYTPWTGKYKISVASDLQSATITTSTSKPSTIDIYLPGDYNEWAQGASNKFRQTSAGKFTFTVPADITGEWKIGSPYWRYDYGYSGAVNPSDVYSFDYNGLNCNLSLKKGDVINLTVNTDLYYKPATVEIVRAKDETEEPPVGDDTKTLDVDGVIYTLYPSKGYFEATDGSAATGDISLIAKTDGLTLRGVAAGAFQGNNSIYSVTIPEGASTIAGEAFRECENLEIVNLPSTLNSIGRYAFLGCTYLNSFNLPAKINSLGIGAFQNCTDLETFNFNQANLTELPDALFDGCQRLREIEIPLSITKIGANAFAATGVAKIGNTVNVVTVGDRAFDSCALAQFDFDKCVTIGNGAFAGTNLKAAEMPSTVTSLGQQAFQNCINLAKVTLPSKLKSIGKSTFEGCSSLTSIEIPSTVTEIYDRAFYNSGLVTADISNNVTTLGANAFVNSNLTAVTLGSGITNLDNTPIYTEGMLHMMSSTPPTLGTDRLGCTPTVVIVPKGSSANYRNNSRWKQYNIIEEGDEVIIYLSAPGALTADLRMKMKIAAQVTSLTIVTTPSKGTLNQTDWNAIKSNMTALIKLDLSEADVETIPDDCFKGKKILTQIVLPNNLKTIGNAAFENCTLLGNVTLPSGLTSIGERAFAGCNSLNGTINIPSACSSIGKEAFRDCYALENVKIESKSLSTINSRTFENCRSLDKLDLPSGLTSIGEKAFAESGLSIINFPAGLKTISERAFEGCFYLSTVSLPSSLNELGTRAFAKSGLVGIILPDAISTLEDETFDSCDDLLFVNLPANLTTVGSRAVASPSVSAVSSPAIVPPATGFEPFEGVDNYTCILSIPAFSFNDYISAQYWGAFVGIHDDIFVTIDGNPDVTYVDEDDYQALLRSSVSGESKVGKRKAPAGDVINPDNFAHLFDGAQMFVPENTATRFFFGGDISKYTVTYNGVDVTSQIDRKTNSWLSPAMSGSARLQIRNTNSVADALTEGKLVSSDVYDITGRLVRKNVTEDQVKNLEPGVYIHNGKKISVIR